jgi:hypothetical protein
VLDLQGEYNRRTTLKYSVHMIRQANVTKYLQHPAKESDHRSTTHNSSMARLVISRGTELIAVSTTHTTHTAQQHTHKKTQYMHMHNVKKCGCSQPHHTPLTSLSPSLSLRSLSEPLLSTLGEHQAAARYRLSGSPSYHHCKCCYCY